MAKPPKFSKWQSPQAWTRIPVAGVLARSRDAAVSCAQSYREHMREYSEMSPLEVWYARIDSKDILGLAPNAQVRARFGKRIAKAQEQPGSELAYPQLAGMVGGRIRIRDNPPLIFHPEDAEAMGFHALLEENLADYRKSLPEDRRILLDRYRLVDAAMKVVGIGCAPARCPACRRSLCQAFVAPRRFPGRLPRLAGRSRTGDPARSGASGDRRHHREPSNPHYRTSGYSR